MGEGCMSYEGMRGTICFIYAKFLLKDKQEII